MRAWMLLLFLREETFAFVVQSSRPQRSLTPLYATSIKKTAPTVRDPSLIRNIAVVGHSHSGKTSLIEWMLHDENVLTQEPTSAERSYLDCDPQEASRLSSVFPHFCRVPHVNHVLEVTDTPWGDFPAPSIAGVDGADAALIVVSAADGIQAGTIQALQHCQQMKIKSMMVLNKMDREYLQCQEVLKGLEQKVKRKPVLLQAVIGTGEAFAVEPLFTINNNGQPIKSNHPSVQEAWMELEEAVAMTDDDLLVEYLENSKLDPAAVWDALRTAIRKDQILPVVYTSAKNNVGIEELMDAIVAVLPSPIDLRKDALRAACESDQGKCGMEPGVEAGFAARVLHTSVDTFGSLSVLRVISNNREADGSFHTLPQETINLRTGEKIKMPSAATVFGLCGKERLPLDDGSHICPGDVLACPKLPPSVMTNDILTEPSAVKEEEAEISIETATDCLTPLSRLAEDIPLMASATVELNQKDGKKKGAKSSAADDKLSTALSAISREDLAVKVEHDSASGKILIRGMSKDHLELVAARLKDRYGLDVELGAPPIQYRETLVKPIKNVEGRHKKQSGGSGQFGVCVINVEPLEEGSGIEFVNQIKGGVISKPFIGSVEKGVMEELHAGGPMGFPVTDVRVILVDGKMHSVDSKDIAFQSAGRLAIKAALEKGKTRLLQPMEKIKFVVDEKLQGEVNGIVSRQEGYVTATNISSGNQVEIEAIVPTATVAEISAVLRAESAGEGQFVSEFSHYQPVPEEQVKQILESRGSTLHP